MFGNSNSLLAASVCALLASDTVVAVANANPRVVARAVVPVPPVRPVAPVPAPPPAVRPAPVSPAPVSPNRPAPPMNPAAPQEPQPPQNRPLPDEPPSRPTTRPDEDEDPEIPDLQGPDSTTSASVPRVTPTPSLVQPAAVSSTLESSPTTSSTVSSTVSAVPGQTNVASQQSVGNGASRFDSPEALLVLAAVFAAAL